MSRFLTPVSWLLVASLSAQDANLLNQLKSAAQSGGMTLPTDSLPHAPSATPGQDYAQVQFAQAEDERLAQEIRDLKAREKGPSRFAADLFEVRQRSVNATEGGISEDYVLGTGDQIYINAFGSATFDLPLQVDGRGQIALPKVGTVKIGGLPLGKAKTKINELIRGTYSNTNVDLTVLKLREVRVFVLGEVYKPGGYLVPSLSSLVNVLSLAGGPTVPGSFRQIRVMRGGRLIHTLDLYPLRAEGLGNMNISFQNGDTIFVPLAFNQVLLEGPFTRITAPPQKTDPDPATSQPNSGLSQKTDSSATSTSTSTNGVQPNTPSLKAGSASSQTSSPQPAMNTLQASASTLQPTAGTLQPTASTLQPTANSEQPAAPAPQTTTTPPHPQLQFELLPGESVQDALRFAGGLLPEAYPDSLSLRRQDAEGLTTVMDVPAAQFSRTELKRGDILSAFPRKDRITHAVNIAGWARVVGTFGRPEGLRVGDMLKRDRQVLPDTYLGRGEIVRTLENGSTQYFSFHLGKAMAGDPEHNLLLEDRDRISLFQLKDMRLPKKVTISGPLTHPGIFDLHDGMRVADLVFQGGVPQKSANRYYAELARTNGGKVSEVRRLDLEKLLSSEEASPLRLTDETTNPLLQADDQVTIYSKPEFKIHRAVRILGQVARPGSYVIESEHFTLSQLIERAGGLTPQAMPKAGIFIRSLETGKNTPEIKNQTLALTEILDRLNETRLYTDKSAANIPQLFHPPVLHGLSSDPTSRLVIDFEAALKKDPDRDVELQDGDAILIPTQTDSAMALGEIATPFAYYKVTPGMTVSDLLKLAGGTTRNADTSNIRLLKADGRIKDTWVKRAVVEPGDVLLIPQYIKRDSTWQENMSALTPLAILINAIKR